MSGLATAFAYFQAFPPRDLAESGSVAVVANGAAGAYEVSTFSQIRIPESDEPSALTFTIEGTTTELGPQFEAFLLFEGDLGEHLQGCEYTSDKENASSSTLQPVEGVSSRADELLRSWAYQGDFLNGDEPVVTVTSAIPEETVGISTLRLRCEFAQSAIWARNLGDPATVIPSTTVIADLRPALIQVKPPRGTIENYTLDYVGGLDVQGTDSGISWTSDEGSETRVIYPHGEGPGARGYQWAFSGQQYFRFKDEYSSSRETQWSVLLGLMLALTVQAGARVLRLRFPSHFPDK